MKVTWLLLRSHAATPYLGAVAVITLLGCALGPDSQSVVTRDGAVGVPLPFVLTLTGVVAMLCLIDPAPELTTSMPRPPWQSRAVRVGFILVVSAACVAVAHVVAPGLTAATVRNLMLALAVVWVIGLWRPWVSWLPTAVLLAMSWFFGTPTYDDTARVWAIPAQPPSWSSAAAWTVVALMAAIIWTLRPGLRARGHHR